MQPYPFIGRTVQIQTALRHVLTRLRDQINTASHTRGALGVPVLQRRFLFTGAPGTGKSHLAMELACLLTGHEPRGGDVPAIGDLGLNCEHRNGQNVSIDVLRQWAADDQYRPLQGLVCVKLVDEIDATGPAALNDLRTYLDNLAPHRVFIATTNKRPDELQPQLQSRFQILQFAPPTAPEIADHLRRRFPRLDAKTIYRIAGGQNEWGNVRAAECDAALEYNIHGHDLAAAPVLVD